jgi:hypothetical protein
MLIDVPSVVVGSAQRRDFSGPPYIVLCISPVCNCKAEPGKVRYCEFEEMGRLRVNKYCLPCKARQMGVFYIIIK